ncbi:MAG: hypothetical protein WA775_06060 [Psychroserpens sp.]|uniref:hypothetical protein n=1 Tax=Psychroserpens sp. TaxID=2020870 RepID=UPI003C75780A
MNILKTISTEYLRASRTLETVLISDENISDVFFIYNYEGVSYRVFKTQWDLIDFFRDNTENYLHFKTENEVDDFLAEVKLV